MPSRDSDGEFDAVLRNIAAAPAVAVHQSGLPAPGTRLANRFIVERCLGEGGMGVVFEALDEERGERVALKTLGRFDGASVYNLKREFRSLAGIAHPNLVRLHELFEDGVWFFTMECVEGESFYAYVRPADAFREHELRGALVGLVRGVCAIHRAGKIHRDLKPGNVLVDRAGHVTILDFGLAQAQTGDAERSTELVAGTPAYMAPEQLAEGGACPASDWYAVGVMLYEALTGRLPFSGSTHEVLAAKRAGRAVPDPREVAPRAPDDLAELALALTRANPDDRPSAAEITKRVDAAHPAAPEPPARGTALHRDVFVGREAELEKLSVAFEATRGGVPSIAYVAGVSGIGKSALVERFVERIGKEAVVLKGRCYERESVPFKALDAVIDALSRYLRNIGDFAAAAMAPRALSELCRVFPVLSRVPGFTRAMSPRALTADPQEVRLFAFGALKELFVRIADRRALVIVIDDMQWGDADSGLLLSRILAPPDPPPLLLIACYRSDEAERTPLLRLLRDEASRLESCRISTIEVVPLEEQVGRTLAAWLLSDRGENAAPELVAAIAAEASGNPFFIAELARRVGHMGSLGGHESLAALVQARVRELPETARRLLEIVTIAGGPLSRAAVLRAAGLGGAEDGALDVLRSVSLLRMSGMRAGDLVETYHDRIRETVAASVPSETARAHHFALAEALAVDAAPPADRLAFHYREAGRRDEARVYALRAADEAFDAVAFDRAAAMYRSALDLIAPGDEAERRNVRRRLGHALGAAGRGPEAADMYFEAATGAVEEDAIELHRRAAYELVGCGELERGLETTRALMARLGIWMPRSGPLAYLLGMAMIAYGFLRGVKASTGTTAETASDLACRVDVVQSLSIAFSLSQTLHAAYLGGVGLLLGVRLGEARRLATSLAVASIVAASMWSDVAAGAAGTRFTRVMGTMRLLAERCGDARAQAHAEFVQAWVAWQRGTWKKARDHGMAAEALLARCSGASAERTEAQVFSTWSLFCLGELRTYFDRVRTLSQEARARRNVLLHNAMACAWGPTAWLALDDVASAEREVADASGRWHDARFQLPQAWALLAWQLIDLYRGDGEGACVRLDGHWPRVRRSGFLFVPSLRGHFLYLRCTSSLAAGAEVSGDARRRRALLGAAERDANSLAKVAMLGCAPAARMILAGVAQQRGDRARAIGLLEEAVAAFEGADMRGYAAAARRQLGVLRGGDEGAQLVHDADEYFRGKGVLRADRFAAMLAPGFASGPVG
jgi:hypothetical protein